MDEIILKQYTHSNPRSISEQAGISFRHPAYDDPEDILFVLPRLDLSRAGATAGVHHGTALLACQIIANNAFDGYLTTDRGGTNRVTIPLDGVLLDGNYWFAVGGDGDGDGDRVYPVVPRFEEWQFPHSHMENLAWHPRSRNTDAEPSPSNSTTSTSVPLAPPPPPRSMSRCILSNNPYAIQKAHIVPTAQSKWFLVNSMRRYGDGQRFINTEENQVPIRHDLHKLWDDYVFALVPKQGGRTFVVHVLDVSKPGISEFASEWHNTSVQEGALDSAAKAFLFAKFAQAVFMLFKPFIAFPAVPRHIATFQARADDDPRSPEAKQVWLSASELSQRYSGGGSRSASASADSRKRSRSEASARDDEEAEGAWYARNVRVRLRSRESEEEEAEAQWYKINVLGKSFESDEEDNWYETNVGMEHSEGEERGRSRQRQQGWERSEHTVDTLPSLTDTSAAGDFEDMDQSGFASLVDPLSSHCTKDIAVDEDVPPGQDTI